MRTPTPYRQLYAWHRAAIAGDERPRIADEPQCGWYRIKLVRNGPWIPVRIWCSQHIEAATGELLADERIFAEQDGITVDPIGVWTSAHPISRKAYDQLVELRSYTPAMADDHAPVDLIKAELRP